MLRISPGLHINPGIIGAINDRLFECYVTMRFKFPTKPRLSEIACLEAFGNAKLISSGYSFQLCCFGNPMITNVAGSLKLTCIRAIIRYQHEEQPETNKANLSSLHRKKYVRLNMLTVVFFFRSDIDECQSDDNTNDCAQICVNVPGSFFCDCRAGYKRNVDQRTCDGKNFHTSL